MREGWRPVYEGGDSPVYEGGMETCVCGRGGDLRMREGWRPVYVGGVETCV